MAAPDRLETIHLAPAEARDIRLEPGAVMTLSPGSPQFGTLYERVRPHSIAEVARYLRPTVDGPPSASPRRRRRPRHVPWSIAVRSRDCRARPCPRSSPVHEMLVPRGGFDFLGAIPPWGTESFSVTCVLLESPLAGALPRPHSITIKSRLLCQSDCLDPTRPATPAPYHVQLDKQVQRRPLRKPRPHPKHRVVPSARLRPRLRSNRKGGLLCKKIDP